MREEIKKDIEPRKQGLWHGRMVKRIPTGRKALGKQLCRRPKEQPVWIGAGRKKALGGMSLGKYSWNFHPGEKNLVLWDF